MHAAVTRVCCWSLIYIAFDLRDVQGSRPISMLIGIWCSESLMLHQYIHSTKSPVTANLSPLRLVDVKTKSHSKNQASKLRMQVACIKSYMNLGLLWFPEFLNDLKYLAFVFRRNSPELSVTALQLFKFSLCDDFLRRTYSWGKNRLRVGSGNFQPWSRTKTLEPFKAKIYAIYNVSRTPTRAKVIRIDVGSSLPYGWNCR